MQESTTPTLDQMRPNAELLKYKCDILKDAVSQASRAAATNFTGLLVLFSVFGLVTYADFVNDQISVPLLALTLNRWHAAAIGPVLISVAALNFASARALLQIRIKLLIAHLQLYLAQEPGADDSQEMSVEDVVGAVLHPSAHVVIDYLYVRDWPGFRFVVGILVWLWSVIPFGIVHMSYTIAEKFHWNPVLIVVYVLTVGIALYSFLHLLKAQKGQTYFDFTDD